MRRRLSIRDAMRCYRWPLPMALILRLAVPSLFDVWDDANQANCRTDRPRVPARVVYRSDTAWPSGVQQ